ncbi:MAG: universal stress protein, partial [Chloroflexota bacterium]
MFRRTFVPLDGSPVSERALPYAESLACATAGTIMLLRAISAPATRAEAQRALAAIASTVEHGGAAVELRVVQVFEGEDDTVADVLVHNARVW